MAKLHFLNGDFVAVEEALEIILQEQQFKDSFEAL
jgi:hypothetical protein